MLQVDFISNYLVLYVELNLWCWVFLFPTKWLKINESDNVNNEWKTTAFTAVKRNYWREYRDDSEIMTDVPVVLLSKTQNRRLDFEYSSMSKNFSSSVKPLPGYLNILTLPLSVTNLFYFPTINSWSFPAFI